MAWSIPFPRDTELPHTPSQAMDTEGSKWSHMKSYWQLSFPAQLQVSKDRTAHLPLLMPFFMHFFLFKGTVGTASRESLRLPISKSRPMPSGTSNPSFTWPLTNSPVLFTPKQTQGASELHGQTVSMSTAGGTLPTAAQHQPVTPII